MNTPDLDIWKQITLLEQRSDGPDRIPAYCALLREAASRLESDIPPHVRQALLEMLVDRNAIFSTHEKDPVRLDALHDVVSDGPRLARSLRRAAADLERRQSQVPSLNLVSFLRQKVEWLRSSEAMRARRHGARFEPAPVEALPPAELLRQRSHEREVLARRILEVHCAALAEEHPELPEILRLLGEGYDKAEVARALGISRGKLYRVLGHVTRWLENET